MTTEHQQKIELFNHDVSGLAFRCLWLLIF